MMSPVSRTNESESLKAEEIIALERAALDVWSLGDPSAVIALLAPEVTYFDPYQQGARGWLRSDAGVLWVNCRHILDRPL